ncbi:hypothetical protein NQ315_005195 [Exocentrus adspersus]|uniref:Major facilitator superfamily (MFS) profile domain-containing protein n=1 Tax=Exocentrus adspersus TaxID=1586481 RepID=A0AAV8VUP2_9CUCU|nr:hypothetical protein NQ315_005195 [Exocentrus adspersus]
MYYNSRLIPARFLILISHFTICVTLLWNSKESARSCLPERVSEYSILSLHTQLVAGLSVAIALLCFEMLAFLLGFTMFNDNSTLLCILFMIIHLSSRSVYGVNIKIFHLIVRFLNTGFQIQKCYFHLYEPYLESNLINKPYSQTPFFFKEISVERPGWTRLLVLAGISTCLGLSLPVGYNIGVVNTPATVIKAFINESVYTRYDSSLSFNELEFLWSLIVSIFLVGAAVGSLGGSVLADRIGRKGVLRVCAGLAIAAAVFFFGSKPANSIEMLAIGRLLAGFSAGLTTSVAPMYLTELAPLHLKGATGALCPLGLTVGVLIGQILSMYEILGNPEYWYYCLSFFCLPVFLCGATIHLLPESPKYVFVIKKQPQVALRLLRKLRDVSEELLQDEIEELKIEEDDNKRCAGDSWNLVKVMTDRTLMLPLLLVCALQAGQQFSGINAVFYYSSKIFRAAGLSVSASELATIGAGCCNFVMAVLSIPIINNINRRTCALSSMASSAFFLVLLGIAIMFIDSYTWVPYFSIIGVLGFVICYGLGMGPIPYFIGSELFEVGPRPSAMALGSMCNWAGNFVVGLLFPTMQDYLGPSSFFIFAAFLVALFIFVKLYLPETRGRDASIIAEICSNGFASKPLKTRINVPHRAREVGDNEDEKLEI